MRKLISCFVLSCLIIVGYAQRQPLEGFSYAPMNAPVGDEWQSPEKLSLNKEQPRSYFFSFGDVANARKVLPENSNRWQSLNGTWKFNWVPNPNMRPKDFYKNDFNAEGWDNITVPSSWNIVGVQKNGSLKYGVPIYVNQPVIFMHSVKVDDWRGGVMRTPPTTWTTFKHRNEVGSYKRDFEVPQDWDGSEIFISFDGVDSFFYLWINGQYVGFSKNSRNNASFNITSYLRKGKNNVAVEVYRSSDGSFLEAQDMFRLPGIFRTVALYTKPKAHIRDLVAIPDLDANFKDGSLDITAEIRNLGKKEAKDYKVVYSLYANELYSDKNTLVANATVASPSVTVAPAQSMVTKATLKVLSPNKWSGESPYRYTLVAELKNKKNKTIETVSTYVGFRKVEIKDTPADQDEFGLAGRYFYVNGMPVKLKGVNRHETHPATGHALTREVMEEEIMIMMRANINHVRNSHYPPDPYFYYLCDKYGIYLEDEANIESHQYYYGEASLSHPKEWRNAHVARVMEMAHATVNSPSIVIWSLGNEAGPGKNFVHAYDALKKFDTSRPVQYERNNEIVDMGSNQYPSIGWMRDAVKGTMKGTKYPFHVSEYAHSMGNACGNLIDYWDAIESTNFFCGGAIWDWVDQSMYNYDPNTGTRYLAYGGDFGDTPNDGQFVMNGIIFADREPKPQYYEVKRVYQYIGVKSLDLKAGKIEVFNKNYYTCLSDYTLQWSLYEDGKEVKKGNAFMGVVAPRGKKEVVLPYGRSLVLNPESEYFVKVQFLLKEDKPWAKKGYVQAEEQLALKTVAVKPSISEVAKGGKIEISDFEGKYKVVKGDNFEAKFDLATGTIYSLKYDNETIIADGNGPKLDALRAFVNNDNWIFSPWFENGLHNLKHKAISNTIYTRDNGNVVISFTVESQAPNAGKIHGGTSSGKNRVEELSDKKFGENDFKFTTNQIWTVYPDGSIELEAGITSNMPKLILPRLGYVMKVPQKYSNFNYYGRGPIDNYADRKTGQLVEQFKSTPADEFVNFPKPQDMGNHEDVRWCALTDNAGKGAVFVATDRLSVSALQYSAMDLILASHPYQLPKAKDTYLHLDMAVTGLGGYSCGQGGPLEHDRVYAGAHMMGFIIRPASTNLTQSACVKAAGEYPVIISRNRAGDLSLASSKVGEAICYTIDNDKKEHQYAQLISFAKGGTITAWLKSNPKLKTTMSYKKVESIQTEVVFASSEEPGSGVAAHLTDNDPNTIWHTMYSVTVSQYPHWIDLDAGSEMTIKGFILLPRQDGENGRIKEYQVQLSNDGKNWGEPIQKGQFQNNNKEQRVEFSKLAKARYIRFTALSSHNKQDFASAAELTILAD